MPKVSVIIPLYNKEKFILQTLQSLSNQTFDDYEVWIINDGSTDNGARLVEDYLKKDARFHLINTANGGVSNARNVGLTYAQGEWIQFLDGDDLINEKYLEVAVAQGEFSHADIVFTNFELIDLARQKVGEVTISFTGIMSGEDLCHNFISNQYQTGFFGFVSNKLFTRRLLNETKAQFPVDIKLAEDLDFYVHLYRGVDKALFLPIVSFYYLQETPNKMTYSPHVYWSQITVQLDICEWFKYKNLFQHYRSFFETHIGRYVYYFLFHTFNADPGCFVLNYKRVLNSPIILYSVQPQFYDGFPKLVLFLLKHRCFILLKIALWMRLLLRRGIQSIRNV